ncbi:MAG TPA: D-Ala-D-Ala carboxypeptidase family metallohydrolase [Kofleriaceae bacterium]|nr:D-Ala-D-Ala carboxypeptidase family metallohydrolase [Kofleriaceae bacterium]
MEREQAASETDVAPQPKAAVTTDAAAKPNPHPGGKDALGTKENLLAPFYEQMQEVAAELAPQFTPLGLHFRPEILLATAMQEAANKDPLTNRSFDNGLGIMQITPYRGKLDPQVAKAINWDNSKDIEYNVQHANWRSAKPNLEAGAFTMLGKAKAIKSGVKQTWDQMDEAHRWRAVLYAYNAGEGSAIKALRAGGPNAAMISSFTKNGKTISHDYTAEIKAKIDYTDSHDPFSGAAAGGTTAGKDTPAPEDNHAPLPPSNQHPEKPPAANGIKASVGVGGVNAEPDVRAVQTRLEERGVDPKGVDGHIGPHTISAIEAFQATFMHHPDGLISNDQETEKHLFGSTAKVTAPSVAPEKPKTEAAHTPTKDPATSKEAAANHGNTPAKEAEPASAGYEAISKNFGEAIPGSQLTWHDALYLPSWHRHAKPSDMTGGTTMDEALANIQKQAAALQKVSDHFGKAIHVHCWLRPPAYNKLIGGAGNSAHLRGNATDFHMDGITAEQVRKVLKADPAIYPGTGENNVSWVHIDLEHHKWF